MDIVFGPEADEDVTAAVIWYHGRSPGLEDRFLHEVDVALSYLKERPHAFPHISEDLRQISVARFPYVIVYAHIGNVVEVVRVFQSEQDERRNTIWNYKIDQKRLAVLR